MNFHCLYLFSLSVCVCVYVRTISHNWVMEGQPPPPSLFVLERKTLTDTTPASVRFEESSRSTTQVRHYNTHRILKSHTHTHIYSFAHTHALCTHSLTRALTHISTYAHNYVSVCPSSLAHSMHCYHTKTTTSCLTEIPFTLCITLRTGDSATLAVRFTN